eukprot:CAMPEP_0119410742 /NCGR_PEP_ID=MMETSP1335-20130426/3674_1 /TAXON_ID=259385 /ORGANISM="Chrysoculter rhomboideus, Strain RCC1486" /LENGTH=61 /DNA_ID=CAMNT_0007435315 /DNA_START=302 /DNA_END=487 /DNA_ORIENTATION=+
MRSGPELTGTLPVGADGHQGARGAKALERGPGTVSPAACVAASGDRAQTRRRRKPARHEDA